MAAEPASIQDLPISLTVPTSAHRPELKILKPRGNIEFTPEITLTFEQKLAGEMLARKKNSELSGFDQELPGESYTGFSCFTQRTNILARYDYQQKKIVPNSHFARCIAMGMVENWGQTLSVDSQNPLNLLTLGILEQLKDHLNLDEASLAQLDKNAVREKLNQLKPLIDTCQLSVAKTLFALWKEQGIPEADFVESQIQPNDLPKPGSTNAEIMAKFQTLYLHNQYFDSYLLGQIAGNTLKETLHPQEETAVHASEKSVLLVGIVDENQKDTKQSPFVIKIAEKLTTIDNASPLQRTGQQIPRERYTHRSINDLQLLGDLSPSHSPLVALCQKQFPSEKLSVFDFGFIQSLMESKMSESQMATLPEAEIIVIIKNHLQILKQTKARMVNQFFTHWFQRGEEIDYEVDLSKLFEQQGDKIVCKVDSTELLKQFEKIEKYGEVDIFRLGRLAAETVSQIIETADFHRPVLSEPPQLRIVSLGETAAQPEPYQPRVIDLSNQAQLAKVSISLEQYVFDEKQSFVPELVEELDNHKTEIIELFEKGKTTRKAFSTSFNQFFNDQDKPISKFAYWVICGSQTIWGESNPLALGIVTALQHQLGLSEDQLPESTASLSQQQAIVDRIRKIKPIIDKIIGALSDDYFTANYGANWLSYQKNSNFPAFDLGLVIGESLQPLLAETAVNRTLQSQYELYQHMINGEYDHDNEQAMTRTQKTISRISHFGSKVIHKIQQLTSPVEGESLFLTKPTHELRRTVASLGVGAIAAEAYRVATDLSESSLERPVQFGLIGGTYFLGRGLSGGLDLKDINWRYLGRAAVRGTVSAATVYGTQKLLEKTHLVPQDLHGILGLPLSVTVTRMITNGVFNAVGINASSESLINSVFFHHGETNQACDYFYFRDVAEEKYRSEEITQKISDKQSHHGKKTLPWQPLADFIKGSDLNPEQLTQALNCTRKYRQDLQILRAHNPTRYRFRHVYYRETEYKNWRGKPIKQTTWDTVDNEEMVTFFTDLEKEIYSYAIRNMVGADQEKIIALYHDAYDISKNNNENVRIQLLKQPLRHLAKQATKRRLAYFATSASTTLAWTVLPQLPWIKEKIDVAGELLLGKVRSIPGRFALSDLTTFNPERVIKPVFKFQSDKPSVNAQEVVRRVDELVSTIATIDSPDTHPAMKVALAQQTNLTQAEIERFKTELGDVTVAQFQLILHTTAQQKPDSPFLQEIARAIDQSRLSDMGKLAKTVETQSLKQQLTDAVKSVGIEHYAFVDYQLLLKLGFKPQALVSQLELLPDIVTPEQKQQLLNNQADFYWDTKILEPFKKTLVLIDGRGENPMIAVFDNDQDHAPLTPILSTLTTIASSSETDQKKAFINPGWLKLITEPNDSAYLALIKAELSRIPPFSKQPQLSSDLINRAHNGDLAAFNQITDLIKINDLAHYNKIFNDPSHNPPTPNFLFRSIQEARQLQTQQPQINFSQAIAQTLKKHTSDLDLQPITTISQSVDQSSVNEVFFNHATEPIATLNQLLDNKQPLSLNEALQQQLNQNRPDIVFVQNGEVVGQHRTYLNLRVPLNSLSPEFVNYVRDVEGPQHENGKQFLVTLMVRATTGNRSGASDPAMQLWEMISGGPNQITLNPVMETGFNYQPEKYNVHYMLRLMEAISENKIPKNLNDVLVENPTRPPTPTAISVLDKLWEHPLLKKIPKIGSHLDQETINLLCWKMESYIFSRALLTKFGNTAVLENYLNYVPFGAVNGVEIFGLESASQVFFGKSLGQLELYQQIMLLGMVQAPVYYSPIYYPSRTAERALLIVNNLEGLQTNPQADQLREFGLMAPKLKISHEQAEELRDKLRPLIILEEIDVNKAQIHQHNIEATQLHTKLFTNQIPPPLQNNIPDLPKAQEAFTVADHLRQRINNPNVKIPATVAPPGTKIFQTTDGTSLVVDLSLPQETPPTRLPRIDYLTDPVTHFTAESHARNPYQPTIDAYIISHLKQLAYTDETGKTVNLPPFVHNGETFAGINIEVFDPLANESVGQFAGSEVLSASPLTPGSTMKPFALAFLLTHTKATLETVVSNQPYSFKYGTDWVYVMNYIMDGDLLNKTEENNKISFAQALAASVNVPFEKYFWDYLNSHPQGINGGWSEYSRYMKDVFGIDLVDDTGAPLQSPTLYAPLGSDVKIGSLKQLVAGYARFANPEGFLDKSSPANQKTIAALRQVGEVLADMKLKQTPTPNGAYVWGKENLESFAMFDQAKTGTAPLGTNGVQAVLTAGTVKDEKTGRMLSIAVQIQGQTPDGRPLNLEGRTGANDALPIASRLAKSLVQIEPQRYNGPHEQDVILNLGALWHNQPAIFSQQPAVVKENVELFDQFGNRLLDDSGRLIKLPKATIVDTIGKLTNGMQPIALTKNSHHIFTAYIRPEQLSDSLINELSHRDRDLAGQLNQLVNDISQQQHYPKIEKPLQLVVIHPEETSPILQQIANDLRQRNLIAMTCEDMGSITPQINLPQDTIFVSESMVRQYLDSPEKLTLLGKVLYHETEHQKQRLLVAAVGGDLTLDQLFWKHGQALPSKSMLEAFTEYRLKLFTTSAYETNTIMKKILDPTDPQMQRSHQAYDLYADLMKAVDENKPIDQEKAKQFVALIDEINQKPNQSEIIALNYTTIDDRPIQPVVAVPKPAPPNASLPLIKPVSDETTAPATVLNIAKTTITPEIKLLDTASQTIEAINPPEILRKSFVAINKDGQMIAVNPDQQFPLWSLIKLPLAAWAIKHYGETDPLIDVSRVGKIPMSIAIRDFLLSFSSDTAYFALENYASETTDWNQGALKMASEFQKELRMTNLTYDSKNNVFRGTANDFMKMMDIIFKTDYLTEDQKQLLMTGMSNQANHQQTVAQWNMPSELDSYYKFGIGPNGSSYSANTLGGTQTGGWWFVALSENQGDAMTQSAIDWQKQALDITKAEFNKLQKPPTNAIDALSGE